MNREIIAWLIDRLKQSDILDEIIIATSTNPQDDILCNIAERENIKFYRGSEDDVIERLYQAAKHFELEYILQITADCPLVSFDFFDKVVENYKETKADLITTFKLPHGFFLYGLKLSALKKVIEIKDDSDTEVWGRYFTETNIFKVKDIDIPKKFQRNN